MWYFRGTRSKCKFYQWHRSQPHQSSKVHIPKIHLTSRSALYTCYSWYQGYPWSSIPFNLHKPCYCSIEAWTNSNLCRSMKLLKLSCSLIQTSNLLLFNDIILQRAWIQQLVQFNVSLSLVSCSSVIFGNHGSPDTLLSLHNSILTPSQLQNCWFNLPHLLIHFYYQPF